MTDTIVVEGQVKFRDGKKWKSRWVVVRKPSPVADCLSVLAYKDKKKTKERLGVTLECIYGVEPGPGHDGVSFTLSILCLAHTLVLGFHSREALLAWDARVRYGLGEVHRFGVNVEPGTKLEIGPASLHLCNNLLALTRGLPPMIIGHWRLSTLRRYGAVPNGFVFEGGTRCGFWAGVFFLSCSDGEQISFLFDCIVRGITPSRVPHGLRPTRPENLNADPAAVEERINQEASELEKRLSMLSTCSLASSTASTYSCRTSVAGDDRSSISSSSSSQSDTSYGSRRTFWAEPLAKLHLPSETASSSSTLKVLTTSDDRLYAAVMGDCGPSSTQLHPRGLHDSGRQSSLDSGIGIATGSSGSFSSCTGSVDIAPQGAGEEFGSVASLPGPPPPPNPPPSPSQSTPHLEHSDGPSCSSRCICQASQRFSDECQNSSLLRLHYDTPRSVIQSRALRDTSAIQEHPSETGRDSTRRGDRLASQDQALTDGLPGPEPQWQALMQCSLTWPRERTPPVDTEFKSTPQQLLLPGRSPSGEKQCCHGFDNYITPEQWRSAKSRSLMMQVGNISSGPWPSADSPDQLCVREDRHDSHLMRMLSSVPPSGPLQSITLSTARSHSACEGSIIRYTHRKNSAMEAAQQVGVDHPLGREGRVTQMDNRRQGPPH
ncbi:protein Dok-7 isoform X2 [Phyllopteryx taeniolatus]|uniref:protein Dok-7 isoform X2 n=1 Tax=Phyllopteryx taeniolatus TaxID=161469 RepID=UPI002AD308B8|nr:protein Dok-7 isoform X2 [Phyllopteryx taeniolatus]